MISKNNCPPWYNKFCELRVDKFTFFVCVRRIMFRKKLGIKETKFRRLQKEWMNILIIEFCV